MADSNTKMTRQEKLQIAIIITTMIVICVMIVAIITLVKYAEEIRNSPIDYAIKNTEIQACVCYDTQGREGHFGERTDINSLLDPSNTNG